MFLLVSFKFFQGSHTVVEQILHTRAVGLDFSLVFEMLYDLSSKVAIPDNEPSIHVSL
jgi:hypothetical protein